MTSQIVNQHPEPRQRCGGYVYAVLFSDGWVKVGRGRAPNARIRSHESISRMRGATMIESIVSGALANSKSAEWELIKFCGSSGRSVWGNEWFSGVDFGEIRAMFEAKFKGDSDREFAQAEALAVESSRRFSEWLSETMPGMDHDWLFCLRLSSLVRTMLVNNGAGGPIFHKSHKGISHFELTFSINAYMKDDDERADLLATASEVMGDGYLGDFLESIDRETLNMVRDLGIHGGEVA